MSPRAAIPAQGTSTYNIYSNKKQKRDEHICQEQAKKDKEISEEQLWNLSTLKQTQGYSGEGEFQFEEVQLNTLL